MVEQGARPVIGGAATYRPRPGPKPLRDLPVPPQMPPAEPALPDRIMLESRRELSRRILRRFPMAVAVLLPLWYVLVTLMIVAIAPTMWLLSPLFLAAGAATWRQFLGILGLSGTGLTLAALVPLLGTAVSLAAIPLATAWVARMNPRTYLTEDAFQSAVGRRIASALVLPPAATLALIVLAIVCQAPLPWKDLSLGVWSGLAASIGAIWCAQLILRRTFSAPRVLGVPDPRTLILQTASDPAARARTSRRLHAQDRRHLPPTRIEVDPAMLGRSLLVTLRGTLPWCLPVILACAWIIFFVADMAVVFPRLTQDDLSGVRSSLPWPVYVIVPVALLLLAGAMALAPALALTVAKPLIPQVTDLRTAPTWAERIRVNPWEHRMVLVITAIDTIALLLVVAFAQTLLGITDGRLGGLGWAWTLADVLVVAPMFALGVHHAMRHGLRDVFYGPAGRYMRRRTPWELVAPELGTRAELAEDPAIRARMRAEAAAVRSGSGRGERGTSPGASGPGAAPGIPGRGRDGAPAGPDARSGPPTGSFALPALPGADAENPLAVEVGSDGLPDFGAENDRSWDEVDPVWSRGADTRRHRIPDAVDDIDEY